MNTSHTLRLAVLAFAAAMAAPAMAEKPEWAGGGGGKDKHEKKHKDEEHGKHGGGHDKHGGGKQEGKHGGKQVQVGGYFNDQHRQVARSYYTHEYGEGARKCPPGLAKKNNGCMPPGQAKKYQLGQPLPASVVYYPVPQPVLVQLPPAPAGHKYVRVAADILLIAVGSSMVVDAISDLMRM